MVLASAAMASTKSIIAVALVFFVSAVVSWRGVVSKQDISGLAKFTKNVGLPCMVFQSLANGVTVDFLKNNYLYVIVGALVIACGFLVGRALLMFLWVPTAMRPWVVLAIAVPNMVGLPMVLIEALCTEKRPRSLVAECFDHNATYLFTVTYSHTWVFWIFCYGYVLFFQDSEKLGGTPSDCTQEESPKVGPNALPSLMLGQDPQKHDSTSNGPTQSTTCGASILPTPADLENAGLDHKDLTQEEPLSIESGPEIHGLGTVADIANGDDKTGNEVVVVKAVGASAQGTAVESSITKIFKKCSSSLLEPPVLSSLLGLVFGLCAPLRELFYADQAALSPVTSMISVFGKTAPGIMNFIAGAALGSQVNEFGKDPSDRFGLVALSRTAKDKTVAGGKVARGISMGTILAIAVARVVVVPCVCAVILFAFMEQLPSDPWGRVIMVFQPAGITASLVSMLAQLLDQPEAAQMIALSTIPQMVLYIIVATLLLGAGIMMNPGLA